MLGRTALIFLAIVLLIGVFSALVIVFSAIVEVHRLLPVLGNGVQPIIQSVVKNMHFPFGELIVATVLLPHLSRQKSGIKAGIGLFYSAERCWR